MRSFATTSTPQLILSALVLTSAANASAADEATGWIGNDHTSAYTLDAGEFELSGGLSRVDETIDFLDLRDDMLAGNSRLIDNSGDLDGIHEEGQMMAVLFAGTQRNHHGCVLVDPTQLCPGLFVPEHD